MQYSKLRDIPLLGKLYKASIPPRVAIKQQRVAQLLKPNEKVLDIGSGNCGLVHALQVQGFDIQAADVQDLSFFPEVKPLIFDGKTLPFADNSFDTATLITVLHHIETPFDTIREALRVSQRLIIMEDVFEGRVQEKLTHWMDSLVNLEFAGHPHRNLSEAAWLSQLNSMGYHVSVVERWRVLGYFRQVLLLVEKTSVHLLDER